MTRSRPPKVKLRALASLDGRTALIRQGRDLRAALSADLGGDLTTAQAILVERACTLAMFCERCEITWLASGELDDSYLGAVGTLRHVLAQIGIKRVARDVTPDLSTYIAAKESTP